jgi:glyceraldehyde 3-phosphate dehydrogenase
VNTAWQNAALDSRWSGVLAATRDPLVSGDVIGHPHGAVVDLSRMKVIGGDLSAVYSWYDNDFGFASTLLAHVMETDCFAANRGVTVAAGVGEAS